MISRKNWDVDLQLQKQELALQLEYCLRVMTTKKLSTT
jgi:hypothetical protein